MNCTIKEVMSERALVPSSILLGDCVINPYRGCSYACRYCYVQKNKTIEKRQVAWGSFVDIKVNIAELLRKELQSKKVKRVLIGSTTEVYQPCEEDYKLMRDILGILNEHDIACTILTKSPLIFRDVDLLKKNRDAQIYFTVISLPEEVSCVIEPSAISFDERTHVIKALVQAGIDVHVYVNPIIPYIFTAEIVMSTFFGITPFLDFEGINLKMIDWHDLRKCLAQFFPQEVMCIDTIVSDARMWNQYWDELHNEIIEKNKVYDYSVKTFFHSSSSFFGILNY